MNVLQRQFLSRTEIYESAMRATCTLCMIGRSGFFFFFFLSASDKRSGNPLSQWSVTAIPGDVWKLKRDNN